MGVRLGENDLSTAEDCDESNGISSPPVQDFTIDDIILHLEYNPHTFFNDIAMIRLNASANLNYGMKISTTVVGCFKNNNFPLQTM